jgi:Clp amino terminal domain, pathogenicity island component
MSEVPDLDRLIESVEATAPSGDPLHQLAAAAQIRDELGELAEALLDHFVVGARDAGCSWSQIGTALGVSKQAAQQRHTGAGTIARRLPSWLSGIRSATPIRLTPPARAAVAHAHTEARRLRHGYIGTEHILLGLLHEPEGIAADVLAGLGVTLPAARSRVEGIVGKGDRRAAGVAVFTPRAKKVLELALREARQGRQTNIGTEHVLLGLIREGDGVAAKALAELGADPLRVRDEVFARMGAGSP